MPGKRGKSPRRDNVCQCPVSESEISQFLFPRLKEKNQWYTGTDCEGVKSILTIIIIARRELEPLQGAMRCHYVKVLQMFLV